jgi:hypothetical protein
MTQGLKPLVRRRGYGPGLKAPALEGIIQGPERPLLLPVPKRNSKKKGKRNGKNNRRSFDSLRSLRMTVIF